MSKNNSNESKKRLITTKERGQYKTKINNALFRSKNIKELLLDDVADMSPQEMIAAFKARVKSHLFIDETIKDTGTYIFYDVVMPVLRPQVKTCKLVLYAICHRDILENYSKENYYGNRADILSQMIEETLLDEEIVKDFGIGDLSIDSIDIYNSTTYYGVSMTFIVPTFR